jgi:hydroxymethylpyrimidine pyrophosphatase-like HAD family hydrolase
MIDLVDFKSKTKYIIAVDMDGTVFESENKTYKIIEPKLSIITPLIKLRKKGCKLIAWTVRDGKLLKEGLEYCKKFNLEFDAVNSNIRRFSSSPKVFAHFYLDDRAGNLELFIQMTKDI